eukprot:9490169-Prorocentrum_lima.AAC.1
MSFLTIFHVSEATTFEVRSEIYDRIQTYVHQTKPEMKIDPDIVFYRKGLYKPECIPEVMLASGEPFFRPMN